MPDGWEDEICDVSAVDEGRSSQNTSSFKVFLDYKTSAPLSSEDVPWSLRREMEVSLISSHDTSHLQNPRNQCYFLISSLWIQQWKDFIAGESQEPPGPISNSSLYECASGASHGGSSATLRKDIGPITDYRGVNPTVWFIYVSLYGEDGSRPICRHAVDHTAEEVAGEAFAEYTRGSKLKAQSESRKMKLRLSHLGEEGGMRAGERPERLEEYWCFGLLSKETAVALLECVAACRCCRGFGVRYRKLGGGWEDAGDGDEDDSEDDSDDGEKSVERSRGGGGGGGDEEMDGGGIEMGRKFSKTELANISRR